MSYDSTYRMNVIRQMLQELSEIVYLIDMTPGEKEEKEKNSTTIAATVSELEKYVANCELPVLKVMIGSGNVYESHIKNWDPWTKEGKKLKKDYLKAISERDSAFNEVCNKLSS